MKINTRPFCHVTYEVREIAQDGLFGEIQSMKMVYPVEVYIFIICLTKVLYCFFFSVAVPGVLSSVFCALFLIAGNSILYTIRKLLKAG